MLPESEEEAERPEAEPPRLGRGGVMELRRFGRPALSMVVVVGRLLPVVEAAEAAAAGLGTPASPEADATLLLDAIDLSLLRRREAGLAVLGDAAVGGCGSG